MAHAEHEHGTYWHLHEVRAEAQQLTDHDRGRDQRAQAPPRQPNDRHKQNGEGNPRHHAEHPLHSVHECARQGCLHDQQSGERGDQGRRFTQTNQLSHHEGRHRRSRHPRSPGQRGPPAGAYPPNSPGGRRAGDSLQPAPDTVYAHSQRSPPHGHVDLPFTSGTSGSAPDGSTRNQTHIDRGWWYAHTGPRSMAAGAPQVNGGAPVPAVREVLGCAECLS